jgi:pantoate kinase
MKVYCSAGLSSFFEAFNNGGDPKFIGARGGGFILANGVTTEVTVEPTEENFIEVYINGVYTENALTSKRTAQHILQLVNEPFRVVIKHKIDVPIAAGFGTSAAGALTTAIALSKTLGLNLSLNEAGMIAHKAEIECKTGLGTVPPLIYGKGCVITVKPGGPGVAVIKRIPVKSDLKLISGVFETIKTEAFLSKARLEDINKVGRETLMRILENPCLENFFEAAKLFAIKTKLTSERVLKLINAVEKAGALGAAQNMIGEGVHSIVEENDAPTILAIFKKFMPVNQLVLTKLSLDPIKILEEPIAVKLRLL